MKVCTDACLFGAWTATKLQKWLPHCENILDIGTGTGLLSLMLAQKTNAQIDAIELDAPAAAQAARNFAASPWKEKLQVLHGSANEHPFSKKYDLIIANPPFYEDDLHSPDHNRNAAMHDTTLTLDELIGVIKKNLADDGYAAVLLPFHRTGIMATKALRADLHVIERLYARQTPVHPFFRSFLLLSRYGAAEAAEQELSIHNTERKYTPEFMELLKDYYLKG